MTVIEDLMKFVCYLAHANENDRGSVIGMEFDDIFQELQEELVKGLNYYRDKNLTDSQLKAVLRRILDNRIAELKYKYYVTHRKAVTVQVSIDVEIVSAVTSPVHNPEIVYESGERVLATRDKLSSLAREVFDAIVVLDNPEVTSMLSTNMDKKIRFRDIALVLGMTECNVKKAFLEIRNAYSEVCYGA